MRERREKKREGSAETQVPLPELPKPEVEVEGLLSEKKRQMILTHLPNQRHNHQNRLQLH